MPVYMPTENTKYYGAAGPGVITVDADEKLKLLAQLTPSLGGLGASMTAAGAGELIYSTAAATYGHLAAGTANMTLLSGGAAAPTWGTLGLTYGGTNANLSAAVAGGVIYGTGSALAATAALTGIMQANTAAAPTAITGTANYLPKWSAAAPYLTATSQIFDDGTKVGIGTAVSPSHLQIAGNISTAAWTTTGIAFDVAAATFTDTSTAGAGTVAVRAANSLGAPTFASTNAITVTDAFTLYVPKPIAGTNTTITRANSAYFEGPVGIGTTVVGEMLNVSGGTVGIQAATVTPGVATALKLLNAGGSATGDAVGIDFYRTIYTAAALLAQIIAIRTDSPADGDGALAFYTKNNVSSSERVRIDSRGKVGIGQTVPIANLDVNNTTTRTITVSANDRILHVQGALTEAASGVHARIMGVEIDPPTITAGVATVTNTATVYISNAPTCTVTGGNYSLWVAAGNSLFGAPVNIVDASAAQLRLTHTATTVYTDFQTTSSGYMYVNPSGARTGIGVAAPRAALDVAGSVYSAWAAGNGFIVTFDTATDYKIGVTLDAATRGMNLLSLMDSGNTGFHFYTGTVASNTEKLTLTSLGKLGVLATAPASTGTIGGNASVGASYITTAAPTNGLLVEGHTAIGIATPHAQATMQVAGHIVSGVSGTGYGISGYLGGSADWYALCPNSYVIAGVGWKYLTNGYGGIIGFVNGNWMFNTCPSNAGGADAAIGTITEVMRITNAGPVGFLTTTPAKQVEINHATGGCLRLTYNDADGSAANYTDFDISASGDLTITPSGGDVTIAGHLTLSAKNIITDTTTGMMVGSAAAQKIGLWGATPVIQRAHIIDAAADAADIATKFNTLLGHLETIGVLAKS